MSEPREHHRPGNETREGSSTRRWTWLLPLAVVTLALAGLLVHAASEQPDGLEKVAEGQGFGGREAPVHEAPVPDYELPWYRTALGKSLVGVGGAALTFGLLYVMGLALRRRRDHDTARDAQTAERTGEAPGAANGSSAAADLADAPSANQGAGVDQRVDSRSASRDQPARQKS